MMRSFAAWFGIGLGLALASCQSITMNNVARIQPGETRGWRVETSDGVLEVTNLHGSPVRVHLHGADDPADVRTFLVEPHEEASWDLEPNQLFFFENPSDRMARVQYRVRSDGEMGAFQVRGVPAVRRAP